MKNKLRVVVPTKWSAITLSKWLKLQEDIEIYKEDENALYDILFLHLCNLTPDMVKQIDVDTIEKIKIDINNFMMSTQCELQNIIRIKGSRYGFEPNLSKMSYGAYLDLTSFGSLGIDKNWSKIMSILYRPVKFQKFSGLYEIEEYTGDEDHTIFEEVGMDVHFGALFFFKTIMSQLCDDTLNSLIPKILKPLHNTQ